MSLSRRVLIVVAMLLATAPPLAAKTYRWVDEQGNVHYSDTPPKPPATAPPSKPTTVETPTRSPAPAADTNVERAPSKPAPVTPAPATSAPATSAAPPQPASAPTTSRTEPAGDRNDIAALVRELMERSGMDRSLEHMAATGQEAARVGAWSTGNAQAAWMALAKLLHPDALAKPAAACVERGLDPGHLPAVLAWIRSPLGEKVRGLEEGATNPAQFDAYRKFVNGLADRPASATRLAAVRTLEEGGRTTEHQIALERAIRTSIARAVGQSAEDDDYDEAAERLMAEERGRFWFVTASLFAYRSLTEDELAAHVRFDRSPAGVWFTNLYWQCLHETVKVTEQRATEALRSVRRTGKVPATAR